MGVSSIEQKKIGISWPNNYWNQNSGSTYSFVRGALLRNSNHRWFRRPGGNSNSWKESRHYMKRREPGGVGNKDIGRVQHQWVPTEAIPKSSI